MIAKRQRLAGRYILDCEIGAGGMGVVWRARDERLGRDVAVKLLAANAIGNDVARARLVREARAAARLQHEGIVHIYDVGETEDGGAFLVMELISGQLLRGWIDDGKLSIHERVSLVVELAAALNFAHELGIVHRDIKPDNVLVRSNSRPVLLDFGLAKPIGMPLVETLGGDDGLRLTGTGAIVGTPAYLAPEQVKGDTVGAAADQFALAVMTFELLTGRLPWSGKTVIEVLASMLHDQPPSVAELVPELPAGIDAVLHRALEKDPEQRFPSVAAFIEALQQLFPELPQARFSTVPPFVTKDSSMGSGSADTGLAKKVGLSRPPAERKRHWIAALVLAFVVLLGMGLVAERARRSRAEAPDARGAASPLLAPDTVVACHIFKVSGELPEPSGWLGAAAAGLACDRIQALLGGSSSRTLVPAELVPGLPRESPPASIRALPAPSSPPSPRSEFAAGRKRPKNASSRCGRSKRRPKHRTSAR
ncbi:MAG TPA: serine/threonine-protein kinase [Polyangiaceae bacterium]